MTIMVIYFPQKVRIKKLKILKKKLFCVDLSLRRKVSRVSKKSKKSLSFRAKEREILDFFPRKFRIVAAESKIGLRADAKKDEISR